MPLKRTSTSTAPTMNQAAIRQLIDDCVAAALEAQAANMENNDNTNKNPEQAPVARKCSYKEFMSCQPFNFKGTNDHKRKFDDRRNTTNDNNYHHNHNNDHHQQQNRRQETLGAYAPTPTKNRRLRINQDVVNEDDGKLVKIRLTYAIHKKSEKLGRVPTEMELILEHTQQGITHEVSVSTEGVEELKRNDKIKGVKKEALLIHLGRNRVNTYAIRNTKLLLGIEDHHHVTQ
nr:hypothetical protein [Tanacetum cinerariifolium]